MRRGVEHGVGVELRDDLVRFRLVFRRVFLRPPVTHVAELVELPALVIERMRHLVSDDGAHCSVIQRVIGIGIVEGRLQNSRREHDLIEKRVLVGVDSGRSHSPFGAVRRLADFCPVTR